jgi:phenylacetate-CoA ligase
MVNISNNITRIVIKFNDFRGIMDFNRKFTEIKFGIFRKNAVNFSQVLEKNQYSKEEIDKINWTKRKEIVNHSYHNSLFYHNRFKEHNLKPEDFKNPEDYNKFPLLNKEDINENFDSIKIANCDDKWCGISITSGSTGMPLKVLHDLRVPIDAIEWRVLKWWDVNPGDNKAFIERVMPTSRLNNFIDNILTWPIKRIYLDATWLTDSSMNDFVESFNQLKPEIIIGHVGSIFEIADFISNTNQVVHHPKAIWVTSAPLSEGQRQVIQKVFGANVYDQYGSREIFWIAAECIEQNGLHVLSDIRHVEILLDDGTPAEPGEIGNIVVTDLLNKVFPLIRYNIGDKGYWMEEECSCGVKLPKIGNVMGRIIDIFRFPDGKILTGVYLATVFNNWPGAVKNYQFYQDKEGDVTLKYVPGDDVNSEAIINQVVISLQNIIKDSANLNIEIVDKIPHDNGKNRFIISEYAK